jgi:tetraacyldisaccharide 4'-kinase
MLARSLPGVAVVVCADRFQAGRVAEEELAATVHILDDGFQHLGLFRDVDLLLVSRADMLDRPLPAGRLREPVAAAAAAHAVLIPAGEVDASGLASSLGVAASFSVRRATGSPRWFAKADAAGPDTATPFFAFAGIARPERFFEGARMAALDVRGTRAFRDHHIYSSADLESVAQAARAAGARALLTTEKDAVRVPLSGVPGFPVAVLPMEVTVEPADAFRGWLLKRIGR